MVNINSNEPLPDSYSVLVNKSCCSYNDIINPCTKLCVPDGIKNMNIKAFNLNSKTNEMRFVSCMRLVRVNED